LVLGIGNWCGEMDRFTLDRNARFQSDIGNHEIFGFM
jgi:hypothetical protein